MIRFVRTTRPIRFSEEAESFFRGEAGFVLHMLDSKVPKTLDEVIESCRSYNEQWHKKTLPKEIIAYSLLRLLEFGMAGIVLK